MTIDVTTAKIRLLAELEALTAAIAQASASAGTVELDQSKVGRVSRIDAMQQQAMAQSGHARFMLRKRKLAAALDRIESGAFGLCCKCRAPIEPERLDADLAAVFCKDCADERES